MQPNNLNEQKLNEMLSGASKKLGISPDELKRRLQSGNIPGGKSGETVRRLMNDKNALEQFINSPQTQAMLKALMNGKGNASGSNG